MVNAGENGTFGQSPTVPLPSISKLPAVKMISPGNGENVTVGIPLSVSGVSSHDGVTNCLISLIINNIKPYQQVSAVGPAGSNDYSKWNYTLTDNYTMLNEGANKLTSKIVCYDNTLNSIKWYSVNVTGHLSNTSSSIDGNTDDMNIMTTNATTLNANIGPGANNGKNMLPQSSTKVDNKNLLAQSQIQSESTSSPPISQSTALDNSRVPVADAGPDQTVGAGSTVTLNGGRSNDLNGKIILYSWVQVSGLPNIALQNADCSVAKLQVPDVKADTNLRFKLTVVDNDSLSSSDLINVLVKPNPQQDDEVSSDDVPCEKIGITNFC
jgi:hypothetical protein